MSTDAALEGQSSPQYIMDTPEVAAMIAEEQARALMPIEERRAGELLKSVLGAARWVPRDHGPVDKMHELDLLMPDGRTIAVEVTTYTAPNRKAFWVECQRVNPILAPTLTRQWDIGVDVPEHEADDHKTIRPLVKRLTAELEPILATVEKHDLYDCVRHSVLGARTPKGREVCADLRDLRVRYAYTFGSPTGGEIYLGQASEVRSIKPDDLVEAAEFAIPRKRGKLIAAKKAGADEAHLFVWVPGGTARNEASWSSVRGPRHISEVSIVPDLQGLDVVWVVADGFPSAYAEIHGYLGPICRLDRDGWHRYRRGWEAE